MSRARDLAAVEVSKQQRRRDHQLTGRDVAARPHGSGRGPIAYASGMFGGIARITAKAGRLAELVDFLYWEAGVCRGEAGTLRFDVWLDAATPDSLILYEAYVDADAFKTHQAGEPFKKFVADIVPNLVETFSFILPFGASTTSNADPSTT